MVAGEPSSFALPRGCYGWRAEARTSYIQVGTVIGGGIKKPRARYDEVVRPWLLGLRLQKGEGEGVWA